MKRLTIIILFALVIGQNIAQTPNIETLIVAGKDIIQTAVNAWQEDRLLDARAYFERLLLKNEEPGLVHYYIGQVDLRLFHFYLGMENKDKAGQYVNDGISHLEKTVELKPQFAEGLALLSSLLGNKISIKPMMGMILGPKSGQYSGQAFAQEPENPRVSLIAGQSAYYTPKMFGGGKDKAVEHFNNAIRFFPDYIPQTPMHPDWGYDETFAFLGLVQMDMEQWDQAEASLNKALEINPDYGWVLQALLPKLERERSDTE